MLEDGGILYSQVDSQLPQFVQTEHTKFSKFIEKYYEFLELNLITFTDLDLNEDAILQEKANTTYTITVATGDNVYSNSANKFYVDGAVSPTITLTSGSYTIFDQGDETNDGHYFHISKTPNGIHTAEGLQFTTDDRGDVLFTYEGTPGDFDNITLEDATLDDYGVLLYEDMTFAITDSDIVFDNIANEDDSGDIFLYNEIITAGGYLSFETGHHVLMEEFTDLSENSFIQSEDFEGRNTEDDKVTRLKPPPTLDSDYPDKMSVVVDGTDNVFITGTGGIVESYATALDNKLNPENQPEDRELLNE